MRNSVSGLIAMAKRGISQVISVIALDRAQASLQKASELKALEPSLSNFPSNTDTTNVFLTEHELAARQKRSVKTIRNQRVLGSGCPFVKFGKLVRYRLSDAIAWERRNTFSSTSDPVAP